MNPQDEWLLEACLLLAYEAWKREWQVELEEHYDNEQYAKSALETIQARSTAMPMNRASEWRQVIVTLRSDKWRDWVRKSAREYIEQAKVLYVEWKSSQNKWQWIWEKYETRDWREVWKKVKDISDNEDWVIVAIHKNWTPIAQYPDLPGEVFFVSKEFNQLI